MKATLLDRYLKQCTKCSIKHRQAAFLIGIHPNTIYTFTATGKCSPLTASKITAWLNGGKK